MKKCDINHLFIIFYLDQFLFLRLCDINILKIFSSAGDWPLIASLFAPGTCPKSQGGPVQIGPVKSCNPTLASSLLPGTMNLAASWPVEELSLSVFLDSVMNSPIFVDSAMC